MDDIARYEKIYETYLSNQPKTPLEIVQRFVRSYFGDADGIEEVRIEMQRITAHNPNAYVRDLLAIEELLNNPLRKPSVLSNLVAWDANWVLDDESDEGAKQWLREVAEMIRDILGDNQPPRREAVTTIQQ